MPNPASLKASASFTRPANTTQYASGDLVANDATAANVVMMTFSFAEAGMGKPVSLRRIKITKSDPDVTGAVLRLWLHTDSAVTFSNGDNGALAIGSSTLAIGSVLLTQDLTFAASLAGAGDIVTATFDPGCHILPPVCYGFLEARGTYTPGDSEAFSVELTGDAYV